MPISRSRLRETLNVSLKSDADFDAFCQDHFPEVYKLFSDGMNRVRKTNVLFEQVEAVQIREALSGQARDVPSLPASSHDLSRAKALQPAAITTNRPASGSRAPASAGSVAPIDGVPAKEGARSTSVETPTRQISHAKVPAVIGALVLVVAALVTVGLMRPPTCPAGRTHFQGACVADHIVDLVKCLEGHKVTKAAEAAERGVRSAAKEGGDDLDVQVRDKVEQEFATLSGDDLRTVILSCAKETSDAELRLPPMTQATASVAPSPTATGMPSAQAPAPTVRLSTDRILQVETPDGERLTVAVKLPEGQAAYLFHVLNPEYDWAYAESKEARLNGQKRDIYREFLDTESFRSAAACSLGIVGVGVASEEGGRAEEEDRAFDRAGQLATWFKLATPSQPLLPTYKLLLGKYARTGASPADKGAKTRGQRKVIVILILAESGHVDHQKGAFLAISRIEANLQGVELKKYSLHKEGFKWLASSGGAPYRPVIPPQCTRYVFE